MQDARLLRIAKNIPLDEKRGKSKKVNIFIILTKKSSKKHLLQNHSALNLLMEATG
jgi:hypothetical protein